MTDPAPVPEAVQAQLERLFETPALFLRDVDPVRGAAVLAPMTADSYRASSFLDTRIHRAADRELALPLATLLQMRATRQPPRRSSDFIFHVGHCGSSLLSRLLGELPGYLALREPPLLMGLARSHRQLGTPGFPISPEMWDALFELSLIMLGRTWHESQRALIKPTSHVASLIPSLMRFTGDERGLLLYVDLPTYLAIMLRAGTRRETRLFAEDFRLRDFAELAPAVAATLNEPSDPQLAAMTWLLLAREFAAALDDPALGARLLPLCFDDFLAAPERTLADVCGFLRADPSAETIAALLAGPATTRHAKSPETVYDGRHRQQELDTARARHAGEIEEGLVWAQHVADSCRAFAGLIERFSRSTAPPALP
jgi:hypothetical protein